jgi:hypothetical protein
LVLVFLLVDDEPHGMECALPVEWIWDWYGEADALNMARDTASESARGVGVRVGLGRARLGKMSWRWLMALSRAWVADIFTINLYSYLSIPLLVV